MDFNGYTKDLSSVCHDLSSIFIVDNSPAAYRGNPGQCDGYDGSQIIVYCVYHNILLFGVDKRASFNQQYLHSFEAEHHSDSAILYFGST